MVNKQYKKICSGLLREIPEKNRMVLTRRFGLKPGMESETLESIGKSFGITRERVRQIEADGLKKIKNAVDDQKFRVQTDRIFNFWLSHLQTHGDLREQKQLLAELAGPAERNHAVFLLTLADNFDYIKETENTHSLWVVDKDSLSAANQLVSYMTLALEGLGKTLDAKELFDLYGKKIKPKLAKNLGEKVLFSYLGISKNIAQGPNGLWGLRNWPEITPRGLRDRAYLVYKKEDKPLHFTEVAKLIKSHGLVGKDREVLHQSVHNDLIRDPRFVLVGRGMYALQEWGFQPGTVREVILSILKESGRPLSRKELEELVLEKRQVKPTTIFLNLQNKEYFSKTPDGKFTITHEA